MIFDDGGKGAAEDDSDDDRGTQSMMNSRNFMKFFFFELTGGGDICDFIPGSCDEVIPSTIEQPQDDPMKPTQQPKSTKSVPEDIWARMDPHEISKNPTPFHQGAFLLLLLLSVSDFFLFH